MSAGGLRVPYRSSDLADLLAAKQLVLMPPEGGFVPTFVPYNRDQKEQVLDHICVSPEARGRLCIEKDWVVASGHLALNLDMFCTEPAHIPCEPGSEDPRDPQRFVKRHRQRAPRRRWRGWREEVAGQFAALLPDGIWDSVHHLQRGILWAARAASATQRRSSRWTPYDEMEKHFVRERKVTGDRDARKVLSKWILQVRGYQTRWRFEKKLADLTAQKKSAAKTPTPVGLKISGQGAAEALRGDFPSFWSDILEGDSDAPLHGAETLRPSDDLRPAEQAAMSSWDSECRDTLISHVDFLGIVMRTPKGKAGGSDGVLGEYLTAMSADQLGMLLRLLTATLQGTLPMPPSWRRADVTLIPKVAGALLAKQYRPITVLSVLQKMGLKVWLHASMPFRPSFQAAELLAIVRMLRRLFRVGRSTRSARSRETLPASKAAPITAR